MLCDDSQRLLNLLRGGRCDKPPFFEPWFTMQAMLKERYAGVMTAMARDLGHAAVPIGPLPIGPDFTRKHEGTLDSGAYYAGGVLREIGQLRNWPEPERAPVLELMQQRKRAAHDAGLACWVVIPWCFDRTSAWMGLENLAMACYDEPDFLHEAMEIIEARNRRGIEQILAHVKPDFVLYNADCAYKSGPMINPDMLRQLTWEPTRKTVAAIAELDIPFTFHTDGRLDEVMPLILDFGMAAVHGCEKQANDLGHLVELFGDRICLCGNMDVVFLSSATPAEVRQQTLEMLEIGNAKKRFIAGCNTSPQDYIPFENYRTFCHTVRDYQPAKP